LRATGSSLRRQWNSRAAGSMCRTHWSSCKRELRSPSDLHPTHLTPHAGPSCSTGARFIPRTGIRSIARKSGFAEWTSQSRQRVATGLEIWRVSWTLERLSLSPVDCIEGWYLALQLFHIEIAMFRFLQNMGPSFHELGNDSMRQFFSTNEKMRHHSGENSRRVF